jgi:glycine cleavage system regulatory protein
MTDLVITILGTDRPGLVETVAMAVSRNGGNWLESRMAHLAGKFAGILRVEAPASRVPELIAALSALESAGLKVVVETSTIEVTTEPTRIFDLELTGLDRPGIVHELAQLFAEHGANVEELATDRLSAPMSGEMLFQAKTRIRLPAGSNVVTLRQALERLASDLLVEIRLVETSLEAKVRRP